MLSRRSMILALAAVVAASPARARQEWSAAPLQLMLVSSPHCQHCRAWKAEIAPGFPASPAGRKAPLFEVDVNGPFPDGLALDRRPRITPSFILLDRGTEIGRVEGYVGEMHFHPVLEDMMRRAGVDLPAAP